MTPAPDDTSLLALRGIVKSWGPRRVLAGVDLTLPPGALVRVKGANGAGKTTLLRVVAGLVRPEGGTVRLHDLEPERDRRHFMARLGFLSAGDGGLYSRLSAWQHLRLCADLALIPRERREQAMLDAAGAFDLEGFADRPVQRISTGQRQRTRLAIAFLHQPDVALLDEPANSLDDHGLALLDRQLTRLRDRGGAALWCAPSAGEDAIEFHSRYVLHDGHLVAE